MGIDEATIQNRKARKAALWDRAEALGWTDINGTEPTPTDDEVRAFIAERDRLRRSRSLLQARRDRLNLAERGRLSQKTIIENRRVWVKGLRSEKFDQAEGMLRMPVDVLETQFSYCCLGVACEVLPEIAKATETTDVWTTQAELTLLAQEMLGITTADHDRLIEMNDDEHESFFSIANAIDTMPIVSTEDWK